jgi:hypothetical protein
VAGHVFLMSVPQSLISIPHTYTQRDEMKEVCQNSEITETAQQNDATLNMPQERLGLKLIRNHQSCSSHHMPKGQVCFPTWFQKEGGTF